MLATSWESHVYQRKDVLNHWNTRQNFFEPGLTSSFSFTNREMMSQSTYATMAASP